MTSRLTNSIERIGNSYLLWGTNQEVHAILDSPEWFTWLGSLTSFHFEGKEGHFTGRLEKKERGSKGYWYAYRKAGKQQYRRYLGTTDKLTLAHLEDTAAQIEKRVLSTPQLEKGKRKPIQETKADLRKHIAEQDKEIEKLKSQVEELGLTISRQNNEIQSLKQQLRIKRL
jgi:type II secretory pathway component HofQ